MITITQDIRNIVGADDNTSWTFYTEQIRQSGTDDGVVISTKKDRKYPVDGVLTVELDPGPAVVIAVDGKHYPFTVPEEDSELWPLIQAAVTIPPSTRHQELLDAVAAWLEANPPDGGGGADVAAVTHAATGKTTPVDADEMPLVDSAASNVLKKLTWANLKAAIKAYYDPATKTLTNTTIDANGTGNSITNLEVADLAGSAVVTVAEAIVANSNDTTLPTSAAVKKYADSTVADNGDGTLTLGAASRRLPWQSGVFASHHNTDAAAFGAYRGTPIDFQSVFPVRDTWPNILNNWWILRSTPEQKLNVAVTLWPTTGSLATDYTTQWQQFAGLLRDGDVVRLGWEMNITIGASPATSSNLTAWAARFASVAAAIKAVNPNILIELCLCMNASTTTATNTQIIDACAGSFDVLSTDFYWWYVAGDTDAAWNSQIAADGGLDWIRLKALSIGVPYAVSEWGIASVADNGTGDSAFFFNKMFAYFAAHPPAYEAYFNDPDNSSGYEHVIYPATTNPTASAAYAAKVAAAITIVKHIVYSKQGQPAASSAATLTTPRNIDGQAFNGSADITVIAPGTHAATGKTTPVDADEMPLVDSAASNVLKKLTWANLKATLKTYFDTLYYIVGGTDVSVADGGTGRSTGTTAYGLIAAGTTATGAQQTISPGTSGQFLKSGGASALGAFANIAVADIAASTATALGVGSIELGAASDTTVSRSAAGVIAVEGKDVAFKDATVNAQTGTTYTLVVADDGKVVTLSNASAITVTVPQDSAAAIPIGAYIEFIQLGAGQVTFAAGTGATLNSRGGALKINAQYGVAGLRKIAANTFVLAGDTTT